MKEARLEPHGSLRLIKSILAGKAAGDIVTAAKNLPTFVRDMMAAPPKTGEGVHDFLFRLARVLHPYRSESDIEAILTASVATCGRIVPQKEIRDAVRNSRAAAWKPGEPPAPKTEHPWPRADAEARGSIIDSGLLLVDQWEASPRRWDDDAPHTEEVIDLLFPGDPLLCCGKSAREFDTKLRSEWRGELSNLSFITPSPMAARRGLTQEGKESAHALSITGPRRFLVVEFDNGTADEQAAILLHLAKRAPLALAIHSGGKSVHGWFWCAGQTETRLRRFMTYAVSVGADPKLWTRSQFARMPDGLRDNGKRQTVYFFNPEVIK